MPAYRRLIFVAIILMQSGLLVYSNHVRTGMLKTMLDQDNVLKLADQVLHKQGATIDSQDKALNLADQAMQGQSRTLALQSKVIEQLRRTHDIQVLIVKRYECESTGSRVVYQ